MRINDLLSSSNHSDVKSVSPNTSLIQVAQMIAEFNIGALPVVDKDKFVTGIISERDLIRALARTNTGFFDKPVFEEMTTPVFTCAVEDTAFHIYEEMIARKIRHIPVTENGKLFSMLSIRDFDNVHKNLKDLSLTDELTGLQNMDHFESLLDNEFNRFRRYNSPLSVLTMQIDKLDELIASRGHIAADAMLKKFADLLVSQTRAYDSVGRVSKGEFSVILPNTNSETATRTAERIFENAKEACAEYETPSWNFTVSIGLTFANEDSREGSELFERSKKLVHQAWEKGSKGVEIDFVH